MDSLQWIDSSALAVERKLGEVTRWEMMMISLFGVKQPFLIFKNKRVDQLPGSGPFVCMFLLSCVSEDFFDGRH